MSCLKPLKAWYVDGETTKNGKMKIYFDKNKALAKGLYIHELQLPCGQCMECRLRRRRDWALRLMAEKKYWPHSYFITLTYDEEHLHRVPTLDKETGEIIEISTLDKKDMQDFLKRYRYYFGKIKFYQGGEYGETSSRAHHHLIVFQQKSIDDKIFMFFNREKQPIYKSETVEKIWGHGLISIGEVTAESAGYVRRYITKKQTGEGAKIYEELGIVPEYVTMSNGIGKKYYDEQKFTTYKTDEVIYNDMHGRAKRRKPPKAWDKLYQEQEPLKYDILKRERRKARIATREGKEAQTEREDFEKIRQNRKKERQKLLKRGDI